MNTEARPQAEALWAWLQQNALAEGPLPPAAPSSPWYLSLMLGLGAWFAGLLAMLASLLTWNLSGGDDFAVLALLWGVPGLFLLCLRRAHVFADQLGLALLVAGECAAVTAIGNALDAVRPTLFASFVLCVMVALLVRRSAAQIINVLAACVCWVLWLRWSLLGNPWDLRHDAASIALPHALLVWALCWGPILGGLLWIVASEAHWLASRWSGFLHSALGALVVALALVTPLADPLGGLFWRESDGARNWLALWPLLSMFAAAVAAAVCFQQRRRGLLMVSLMGLLVHVGHFYYLLGVSLIAKSALMLLIGIGLLLLAWRHRETRA